MDTSIGYIGVRKCEQLLKWRCSSSKKVVQNSNGVHNHPADAPDKINKIKFNYLKLLVPSNNSIVIYYRTTNGSESFHCVYNSQFYHARPHCCLVIKVFQSHTETQIRTITLRYDITKN